MDIGSRTRASRAWGRRYPPREYIQYDNKTHGGAQGKVAGLTKTGLRSEALARGVTRVAQASRGRGPGCKTCAARHSLAVSRVLRQTSFAAGTREAGIVRRADEGNHPLCLSPSVSDCARLRLCSRAVFTAPAPRGVRCCDRHKGTGRAIDLEPLTDATAEAGSMGWVEHPNHTIREVLMHRQPVVHPIASRL